MACNRECIGVAPWQCCRADDQSFSRLGLGALCVCVFSPGAQRGCARTREMRRSKCGPGLVAEQRDQREGTGRRRSGLAISAALVELRCGLACVAVAYALWACAQEQDVRR
eukprot:389347-Prymnesium_polylepis.3